ncbi:putative membrane protein [Bradyrhizobium sp. F1.13.1]
MTLAATELAFRAAAVALLLVLAASLLSDCRNVLAARLGAAFALGSAAHAVSYFRRNFIAGPGMACAADRGVDRQYRGVLAVHARIVRR